MPQGWISHEQRRFRGDFLGALVWGVSAYVLGLVVGQRSIRQKRGPLPRDRPNALPPSEPLAVTPLCPSPHLAISNPVARHGHRAPKFPQPPLWTSPEKAAIRRPERIRHSPHRRAAMPTRSARNPATARFHTTKASWRSGDAADCKSVYTGSIPVLASIPPRALFRPAHLGD